VRDLRHVPGLEDALRTSVGQPAQNKALLAAIAACAPGPAR
jgi:histidinol-phosphate/aromatic aminotransferase/cobyric acid decarboxylase-like protein